MCVCVCVYSKIQFKSCRLLRNVFSTYCILKIFNLNLKVKATEIQTHSIFLVDAPMYQFKKKTPVSLHSLVITFPNLGVHIAPLPVWQVDDNTPSTFFGSGVKKNDSLSGCIA